MKLKYIFLWITMCFIGFLTLFSYEITRPLADSILNKSVGPEGIVYAWLSIAIFIGIATYIYNKLISIFKYYFVFFAILIFIAITTYICWHFLQIYTKATSIILYSWKDIYILIIVEQLWSFCNSTFNQKSAKKAYGLFMTFGSIGSMLGAYMVNNYVHYFKTDRCDGSINMILLPIPCFILAAILFLIAAKLKQKLRLDETEENQYRSADKYAFNKSKGFGLVFGSPFLFSLLLVVCCIQISTAFLDFQFRCVSTASILKQDDLSAFTGKIYFYVGTLAWVFQLILVPFMLNFLGSIKTHFIIPVILFIGVLLFTITPTLSFISIAFVAVKTMDYSVFRGAKEMLYMPFNAEVQYKAKAVIDMFGYRFIKVLAGFIILSLKNMPFKLVYAINIVVLAIIILWIFFVIRLKKYFKLEYITNIIKSVRAEIKKCVGLISKIEALIENKEPINTLEKTEASNASGT